MSKIIILIAAGYTNCIANDIGRQVKDDGVEMGLLKWYDNITREWWVETTANVIGSSAMTITAGTGAGTTPAYTGYCTINQIKERCLIAVTDTGKDAELESAGIEASRHIDEVIRPHLTYRQSLTLAEADYTNCIRTDVGKQVLDDEVKVGELLEYNNTTRVWKIKTTGTIADLSEMKIEGVVRGTASGASIDDVTEAESPIFIFKTLPLVATIPAQIKEITADFGAAIFLRRYIPDKYGTEWWTNAVLKIEEFIKSNWYRGSINFV